MPDDGITEHTCPLFLYVYASELVAFSFTCMVGVLYGWLIDGPFDCV